MRRRAAGAVATGLVLTLLTWMTMQGLLFYRPLPTIDGYYRFLGLDERAEVVRDTFGVPRIEAGTLHDLFFLQGYITAQDRFAQMDAMRRGADIRDETLRLGAPQLDPVAAALEAYAAGVTKWIDQHAQARALPAAIALSGQRPAAWAARDSLAIAGEYLGRVETMTCVAIDGGRTARGRPLLSADLRTYAPAPGFYEIGLQAGALRAIGASLPGVPGILAGHNGAAAWALISDELPLDAVHATGVLLNTLVARDVREVSNAFGRLSFCAADASTVGGPTLDHLDQPIDVELVRSLMDRPRAHDAAVRLIIDLGDLDASKAALSTGQSGHPAADHYGDQAQMWTTGQLHRLGWTQEAIARTEGRLVLRPR